MCNLFFALAFDSGKLFKHTVQLPHANSFLLDLLSFERDDGDKLSFLKLALERGKHFDDWLFA